MAGSAGTAPMPMSSTLEFEQLLLLYPKTQLFHLSTTEKMNFILNKKNSESILLYILAIFIQVAFNIRKQYVNLTNGPPGLSFNLHTYLRNCVVKCGYA